MSTDKLMLMLSPDVSEMSHMKLISSRAQSQGMCEFVSVSVYCIYMKFV